MKLLFPNRPERPRAVIFLSGRGSNARVLLEKSRLPVCPWTAALLLTDRPESRADELGKEFHVPVRCCPIRDFYRDHGLDSIAMTGEEGRRVRELWTGELRRILQEYPVHFGLLAGFIPMTNIVGDLPCLNVHPGDLYREDERHVRVLAGLHTRPLAEAVRRGYGEYRSSVILARPYGGDFEKDMDGGYVLGISPSVPVLPEDLPCTPETLNRALERIKRFGDHVVFPAVVRDFARGCFAGEGGTLFYRENGSAPFRPVLRMEYTADGTALVQYRGTEE